MQANWLRSPQHNLEYDKQRCLVAMATAVNSVVQCSGFKARPTGNLFEKAFSALPTMCRTIHRRGSKSLIAIIGLTLIGQITACGRTILRAGLSQSDKQLILDMHNAMRQKIALGQIGGQPPAKNMMEMKWDDELARKAQNWALTCLSETHDAHRHVSRFPVGQNIATSWTTRKPRSQEDSRPDFADMIGKWFDEFKYFSFGGPEGRATGHYTQMIWAQTNLVGCGYSFYYDPSKGFTKIMFAIMDLVVPCQLVLLYNIRYMHGNVIGASPYAKGYPSCVQSGLTDSRKYLGLCDASNNYAYSISNYIV
ncbi:hypothetical protein NQ318_010320 [Aromia moschata]|uniref:SCP domain-containing protein n=1 Tax=Aromia moschata TaxID=1265417 RepID=A0AAV8YGV1_9CUCU|nr:hypothetical protein NQ318_010320 [Aromia moschata]